MKVIYVMENKINGKRYIGQTNNFQKRMNGHRSDANNKNSHSYNLPLAAAIRKYGWDNFNNYIIEEYPDDTPVEHINEREIFFINFFASLVGRNGYNLMVGRPKGLSIISSPIEKQKIFSPKEKRKIQEDISRGLTYKSISKKWNISPAMCSLINSGKQWHDETLTYPLCRKGSNYLTNLNTWVKDIQRELIFGRTPMTEIAKKYNKSYSTVKKINCGSAYRMEKYKYPLTSNRPQDNNQSASTIPSQIGSRAAIDTRLETACDH